MSEELNPTMFETKFSSVAKALTKAAEVERLYSSYTMTNASWDYDQKNLVALIEHAFENAQFQPGDMVEYQGQRLNDRSAMAEQFGDLFADADCPVLVVERIDFSERSGWITSCRWDYYARPWGSATEARQASQHFGIRMIGLALSDDKNYRSWLSRSKRAAENELAELKIKAAACRSCGRGCQCGKV